MLELSAYIFLISMLCTALLTPLAIRLGKRWGVVDHPGARKIHLEPIPLSGGWVLFTTITVVLWGHLLAAWLVRGTSLETLLPDRVRYFVSLVPQLAGKVAPVYGGALAVFLLGLADDVRGMSVRARLLTQVILGALLAMAGLHPQLGFLPGWAAAIVGIVWIVGITNAFNFLDGLDGLSTGVALVATLALLTIMGISNQPHVLFYLALLVGCQLGFLRYNFHPARIFLGSSGSLLLGYLLAASTLLVTFMKGLNDNWLMPLLTPVFILAIPIYDTCSVVLIRLLQRRNIAIGDQSHFHHRLMRLGFSHRQTVAFIILIAFSVALSGVRLVHATLGQSLLILLQIMVIMSILILAERVAAKVRNEMLERKKPQEPMVLSRTSPEEDGR
jgi:UDP-GlcNAc:undecaprenyl-phosphate/decaprenyl-phosphate GlcNAc-1-phosphate transferase